MSYYSRHSNILFILESLEKLRELSMQFHSPEYSESFIIRLKMMEHLARLAFTYSLKVSYLNETTEYAQIAEILDDVLLQLRRNDIRYAASKYGHIVTREYESMQDELDILDERLKTIRVVCFNRRDRKVSKNSIFINEKIPKSKYSNKGTYVNKDILDRSVHQNDEKVECTSPKLYRKTLNFRFEEDDEQSNYISNADTDTDTDTDTDADIKFAEENAESDRKFAEFKPIIIGYRNRFMNCATEPNPEVRLTLQCNEIIRMFKCIIENIEYISGEFRFRKCLGNERLSFMQVCIRQCVKLDLEINVKYDKLRRENKRANTILRAAKIEAIHTIKTAKHILCKYYIDNPVEMEPLDHIVNNK